MNSQPPSNQHAPVHASEQPQCRTPKLTPTALGPDSLAWKHAGDNLQLLIAGTTLVLQVSHPVVGAGVGDHSVFKKDPWCRLQRTTEWGLRLLYGGQENAVRSGQALRELHRDMPKDLNAFWVYFDNMVEQRLEVTDTALYLLDVSLKAMRKPPALKWLPTAIWKVFYRSAAERARLATIAAMPALLRAKFGLEWNAENQKQFKRMQRWIKALTPLLPGRIRYLAPAYHALKGRYDPQKSAYAHNLDSPA